MYRYNLGIVILFMFSILSATGELLWDDCVPVVENDGLEYDSSGCQLEDGSTMITWCKNVNGNRNIYVMRYERSGAEMWTEPRIAYSDITSPFYPEITTLSDGNVMVHWTFSTNFEDWDVQALKIDAEANPLWNEPYVIESDYHNKTVCVPDDEGGAYLLSLVYSSDDIILHFNSDGEMDWEDNIEMFGDMNLIHSSAQACPDGEGGIIIAGAVYSSSSRDYFFGIQRITPEGDAPWGDDGYIILSEAVDYDYVEVLRTGENQFAMIHQIPVGDYAGIHIYRFDLDGLLVSEASYDFGYSLGILPPTADAVLDQDGNIYIAWSIRNSFHDKFSLRKVTPDNQLTWDVGLEGDGRISEVKLSLATDGALCLAWEGDYNGDRNASIQRYDQDGNPQWEAPGIVVTEGVDVIDGLNLFPIDGAMLVFWEERLDDVRDLCRQMIDSDGEQQLDEDEIGVMRGYNCDPSSIRFAECDELPDRLAFTWSDEYWYFQTLDFDEALSAPYPGTPFFDDTENHGDILAMEQIEDDYIIVWRCTDGSIQSIHVNRFDQSGNYLWQNDLTVHTSDTDHQMLSVEMDVTSDEITIAWIQVDDNNRLLMAQKILDGQPVWTEPVTLVTESTYARIIDIIDDYFIWQVDYTYNRILRINSNGSPYDGWDDDGSVISQHSSFSQNFVVDSREQGLSIAWVDYTSDDDTIYLQTVSEDGTIGWDGGNPLHTDSCYNGLNLAFSEHVLFATWHTDGTTDDLFAMAFDMSGNPLWDEEHSALGDIGARIYDIAATPDGCLLAGRQDGSTENERDVILQHIDFEGNIWDDLFYVCDLPGEQLLFEIIPAQDNKYFITWEDYRNYGVNFEPAIYAQLYQYDPLSTDDPTDISVWEPNLCVYPNPFNPETTVRFSLAADSKVELKVFNVKGQLVRTLCDEALPVGNHEITWDGTDNAKNSVSSGVYLIDLNIDGKSLRNKALLLK